MGLLEQQKQNKKLGNQGMSFIEILVVVAIIAVLAAGTISIVGLISAGDVKKAARTTVTDLADLKNRTLSIYGTWHGEIAVKDGSLEVSIFKDTTEQKTSRLGARVEAKFYAGGELNGDNVIDYVTEYDLMDPSNKLVIFYSPGTGAIESIKVGDANVMEQNSNCGYIRFFVGDSAYVLKLYYKTGKTVADL